MPAHKLLKKGEEVTIVIETQKEILIDSNLEKDKFMIQYTPIHNEYEMDFGINAKDKPDHNDDKVEDYDNPRFWDLQKKRNLVEVKKIQATVDGSILSYITNLNQQIQKRDLSYQKWVPTPSSAQRLGGGDDLCCEKSQDS